MYFFREDNERPTPTLPVPTVALPGPQFSTPVVHRKLSVRDTSKGAVPDDIHPQIVRWLVDFLAEPLFKLFDSSDSGTYRLALGHYMFNT